ncbi:hypothetical protein HMPREF0995_02582 [Lachnospiraceae bacterium 7_1_58FAA]|nr:hypothetical protein HMPREF0995_02582 [Lachnospiraceae bacterium 7_1_58FAA]
MEYLANAFPALLIMVGLFAVLAIGGFVADKALPKSRRIEKFISNLPMNWD